MVLEMAVIGAIALAVNAYQDAKRERQRERERQRQREYLLTRADLPSLHQAMPLTGRQIRILELQSGNWDDSLDCQLEIGNVDYSIYEALSYTWRAPPDTRHLTVNGVKIDIRENLYWALMYLRPPVGERPRRLWVDAICINQGEDNSEKDEQLPLMGDIYREATRVLAWLGKPDQKSENALRHFDMINDGALNRTSLLQDYHRNKERWFDFGESLLTRDWFTRAWTVQEFVCARELRFVCGHDSAPEELFGMIGLLSYSPGLELQRIRARTRMNDVGIIEDISSLFHCKEVWKTGEAMQTLVHWIAQFLHRECGDHKDHIYAYLALDKKSTSVIKPDRKSSWQALYQMTTRHIIEQHKALDFICIAQGDDRDANLPSWVPDLRSESRLTPVLPRTNLSKPVYNASGGRDPDIAFDGDGTLSASGRMFRKIVQVTQRHSDDEKSIEDSRRLATESLTARRNRMYPSHHGHTYQQAFARTIVMDMNVVRERCGENEGFREWKDWWGVLPSFEPGLSSSERTEAFKHQRFHQERKWRMGRRRSECDGAPLPRLGQQARQLHLPKSTEVRRHFC